MMLNRRVFLRNVALSAGAASLSATIGSRALAAGPIRVGVLIPGSRADHGWMESAYAGIVAAQTRYGDRIKITSIENVKFGDMEQVLVTLAAKNDLVIGAAGQTQASVLKVAKRFPKVKFTIVGPTGLPTDNVAQYDVLQAQIGFVAGAVAAMLSKRGAVSYVGGLEIPAIVNTGKEFGNGARYVRPDIKYIETYTGDFDDVAKAKEATLAAIAQGADMHYNILNLGVRGMEQAARDKGTRLIGSYSNYCGDHNALYAAYTISGIGFMVEYAIDQMMAGTWKPEAKVFGLAMGPRSAGIEVCSGATPELLTKVQEIQNNLLAGKIKVLVG
ncbi:ABC transporter periplasmic protein [Pandoraea terrae]|uniref:ABC transporter periplasmic protein n=1 Tax=Pandoraea terrae TaxID=1537710 RepID=A0A5E4T031_9BURK|nr:BMP family protein [Pandoraea terrae]VVD81476.1 ABC transporter periplasmic protein [Pandoraea terrae]